MAAIADPAQEGGAVFLKTFPDAVHSAPRAADGRAASGTSLSPLDGRIVLVKGLFDLEGEGTSNGSAVLRGQPAASAERNVDGEPSQ